MTTVACRILTPWLAVLIGRWACSLCVSADFRRSCRVRKPEVLAPRLCVALDGTLIRSDLFLESLLLLLKRNPLYLFHTLVMVATCDLCGYPAITAQSPRKADGAKVITPRKALSAVRLMPRLRPQADCN